MAGGFCGPWVFKRGNDNPGIYALVVYGRNPKLGRIIPGKLFAGTFNLIGSYLRYRFNWQDYWKRFFNFIFALNHLNCIIQDEKITYSRYVAVIDNGRFYGSINWQKYQGYENYYRRPGNDFCWTGNAPLVIKQVDVTCGCTTPEWPKEPIAPGKSGTIKAVFNSAGKMGQQNKVITVQSNAVNAPTQVTIVTNIQEKAPAVGLTKPATGPVEGVTTI